jgi:hypothetical protein
MANRGDNFFSGVRDLSGLTLQKRLKSRRTRCTIALLIDRELLEGIELIANDESTTMSAIVESIIVDHFGLRKTREFKLLQGGKKASHGGS